MKIWRKGRLRLFVSHSYTDRKRVADLAERMERAGIHAFVAHRDIRPTSEWQNVIDHALRSCHAMLAYLTPKFRDGAWTGQETGYCLQREVLVLSVTAGLLPFGFLARAGARGGGSRHSSRAPVDCGVMERGHRAGTTGPTRRSGCTPSTASSPSS